MLQSVSDRQNIAECEYKKGKYNNSLRIEKQRNIENVTKKYLRERPVLRSKRVLKKRI